MSKDPNWTIRTRTSGRYNDTEQEKSSDALYLGCTDNGSGHIVFKADTKAAISFIRVVVIPTS